MRGQRAPWIALAWLALGGGCALKNGFDCADGCYGESMDGAGTDMAPVTGDDGGADLSANADQAVAPDQAAPADQSATADQAVAPDQAAPADQSATADQAVAPDQAAPADQSITPTDG